MTFGIKTWSTPRRKNRFAVLVILVLAVASTLLIAKYKFEWLMLIIGPLFVLLLQPLVIAFPPGEKLAWVIDKCIPGIHYARLTEIETRKAEYRAEVDAIIYTVKHYGLCIKGVDLREEILHHPRAAKTEEQRLDHCTQVLENIYRPSHPYVTATLLRLLYYEVQKRSKIAWANYKEGERLDSLINVLTNSKLLPASSHEFPYKEQLERILRPLEEFAIDTIQDELRSLAAIWRVSERYGKFLDSENDLPVRDLNFKAVLDQIEKTRKLPTKPKEVQELQECLMEILLGMGDDSIMREHSEIGEEERRIHSLIALEVFLNKVVQKESIKRLIPNLDELLKGICGELGSLSDSYPIILAYLDLRRDVRNAPWIDGRYYVSIHQLISRWRVRYGQRASGPELILNEELGQIEDNLNARIFPTRLLPVTAPERLNELKREYGELFHLVEERKAIHNTLRRIFRDLDLATVERFMEVPGSDAYLLTFSSLHGNLAQLIDCLVEPDLRQNLQELGIEFVVAGGQKYNFKHYTSSARIGVLPTSWSFENFATALQHDVGVIIGARQTLFPDSDTEVRGLEILVHRFNLSENDYLEFKHERGRRHAVLKIRDLLSETLPPDQQLALLKYDGKVNIIEAILAGPIAELTGDEIKFTDEERKGLEDGDHALKYDLIQERKAASIRELAQRFAAPQEQQEAVVTLTRLLEARVPGMQRERCEEIAGCYVRTLEAIASISAG